MSSDGAGAGRREVAWRVFAAEYDDAWFSYSEGEEERAPNYVVTPTGARVNRLFVVGVLTEVESVSDEVLRARVVDPTGAFVIYAGQYQPEALAFLERVDTPAFVAVTGKARTFEPDDADVVYTSIRPETINEVDADTRDRWVVATAEQTLDRVSRFADALDRPERGDDLRERLLAEGVDIGLAAGIPLAVHEYGTTKGYLAEIWDLAVDAARVVAGEISADEVGPVSLAPDEGGDDVDVAFDYSLPDGLSEPGEAPEPEPAESAEVDAADAPEAAGDADDEAVTEAMAGDAESEADEEPEIPGSEAAAEAEAEADAAAADAQPEVEPEQETSPDEQFEPEDDADAEPGTGGVGDEMYEFDEAERERVEEEHGLEFSTGTEVESPDETPEPGGAADADPEIDEDTEPGEVDAEVTEEAVEETDAEPPADEEQADALEAPDDDAPVAETGGEAAVEEEASGEELEEAIEDAGPGGDEADEAADEAEAPDEDAETTEAAAEPADLDADELEDVVVDYMADFDEGEGAPRDELAAAVVEDYGVSEDEVADAIQDALMAGRCFEPDDDHVKPI
jgi:RPA family protein